MSITLPPTVAAFIAAENAHDSTAFVACFTADAVVHDDGHVHHGIPEIKAWIEHSIQEYQQHVAVTAFVEHASESVLTAQVSGTFDGSPLQFYYHFVISGDKISALSINV